MATSKHQDTKAPKPPTLRLSATCAHGKPLGECQEPITVKRERWEERSYWNGKTCADLYAAWLKVDGKPRKPSYRGLGPPSAAEREEADLVIIEHCDRHPDSEAEHEATCHHAAQEAA